MGGIGPDIPVTGYQIRGLKRYSRKKLQIFLLKNNFVGLYSTEIRPKFTPISAEVFYLFQGH